MKDLSCNMKLGVLSKYHEHKSPTKMSEKTRKVTMLYSLSIAQQRVHPFSDPRVR